ncbi:MAG TPA: bifunctional aspartate kinase/homoserine dehydrogenase I [Saprospiraceae bacterium]|jgi:aspartokinase/homoserine dehydrogenase 1|nr:bifunctional aspartate kinase/homoserine dehydrogenase I [Saprospiraceae bacterium]HRO07697.1 bifunctional aspartate kinase/homoserine dehydrogenase I [Saprospiraceae bacterium]HRP41078.1 bifunctional aspartate kinase/homoserine dehydrogenase I [Saprospiraceae bacterium]
MKVIKLGGKSLAASDQFEAITQIVHNRIKDDQLLVVVSAIGDTTDTLEHILNLAKSQHEWLDVFDQFKLRKYHNNVNLESEFKLLEKLYEGVFMLEDYSLKVKDLILAQGELISAKILSNALNKKGYKAEAIDSRHFFKTDEQYGNGQILEEESTTRTKIWFSNFNKDTIGVVTGFIASTLKGDTTTLGRNGSNYSAALLSEYLQARELQNFTHVDGIYTANPEWVRDARKIEAIHFNEASELANLGASILHGKTIQPLIRSNIPLRILNTLNPNSTGTLISAEPTSADVKTLSIQNDVALIQLEGRGLLGKVGIDARVFNILAQANISVGLISQGTSERGLGFIVKEEDAGLAVELLDKGFETYLKNKDVSSIYIRKNIAVISIIGQDLSTFDRAYTALIKNNIIPLLFSNSVTGKNVSIVVERNDAQKAINVIHGQIFGIVKKVHLAIFGHGLVGSALIEQVLASASTINKKKEIQLKIISIANSQKNILNENGLGSDWKTQIMENGRSYTIDDIIRFVNENHLENLIAIDNTASSGFIENYVKLIENGFDIVSSNKNANTQSWEYYTNLRKKLREYNKEYLYETNVGAGLPLIDTIKLLHLSGENITRIRGVFSGTLSYIFNTFSKENKSFSEVLKEAISKGYTEPDPREDLSGNDVARKLLVLARELELKNEWDEIDIQNLIPEQLQKISTVEFLSRPDALDIYYDPIKDRLKPGYVFRYVGELSGDLQLEKGLLTTQLIEISENSALGQLKGSDSIFEIYTESYGDNPIVIQGAGAGANVTARGVFGDILRLSVK